MGEAMKEREMASEPEVTPLRSDPPKITTLPDGPAIPRTALAPDATTQISVQLPTADSLGKTFKSYIDIAAPVVIALVVIVVTICIKRYLSDDEDRTDHGISR